MTRRRVVSGFDRMIASSPALWTLFHDGTRSLFASPFQSAHTREALIEDAMSIPQFEPYRDAKGFAHDGPKSEWTRDHAERSVDALGPLACIREDVTV